MKIRTSFVTNSSSSSFLIKGKAGLTLGSYIVEHLTENKVDINQFLAKLIDHAIENGQGDTYSKCIRTAESWGDWVIDDRFGCDISVDWRINRAIENAPAGTDTSKLKDLQDKTVAFVEYLENADNWIHCRDTYNKRLDKYIKLLSDFDKDLFKTDIEDLLDMKKYLDSWNDKTVYYKGEIDYDDSTLSELFKLAKISLDD